MTWRWQNDAACKGIDPDLFFPQSGGITAPVAKAACKDCPVKQPCLDDALANDEWGYRGGTTLRDRENMVGRRIKGPWLGDFIGLEQGGVKA